MLDPEALNSQFELLDWPREVGLVVVYWTFVWSRNLSKPALFAGSTVGLDSDKRRDLTGKP